MVEFKSPFKKRRYYTKSTPDLSVAAVSETPQQQQNDITTNKNNSTSNIKDNKSGNRNSSRGKLRYSYPLTTPSINNARLCGADCIARRTRSKTTFSGTDETYSGTVDRTTSICGQEKAETTVRNRRTIKRNLSAITTSLTKGEATEPKSVVATHNSGIDEDTPTTSKKSSFGVLNRRQTKTETRVKGAPLLVIKPLPSNLGKERRKGRVVNRRKTKTLKTEIEKQTTVNLIVGKRKNTGRRQQQSTNNKRVGLNRSFDTRGTIKSRPFSRSTKYINNNLISDNNEASCSGGKRSRSSNSKQSINDRDKERSASEIPTTSKAATATSTNISKRRKKSAGSISNKSPLSHKKRRILKQQSENTEAASSASPSESSVATRRKTNKRGLLAEERPYRESVFRKVETTGRQSRKRLEGGNSTAAGSGDLSEVITNQSSVIDNAAVNNNNLGSTAGSESGRRNNSATISNASVSNNGETIADGTNRNRARDESLQTPEETLVESAKGGNKANGRPLNSNVEREQENNEFVGEEVEEDQEEDDAEAEEEKEEEDIEEEEDIIGVLEELDEEIEEEDEDDYDSGDLSDTVIAAIEGK